MLGPRSRCGAETLSAHCPTPLIQLRITRHNRYSVAALLAAIEETAPQAETHLLWDADVARGDGALPGVLLYSFMTPQAEAARLEVRRWRERLGDRLWLVAGGAHPSGAPAATRAMGFDWVVRGEAAAGFEALLRDLLRGQPPPPGILSGGRRRPLDAHPPWPRSGTLFGPMELTRGCPMRCAFCQTPQLHGRRPRHRSLESIDGLAAHARDTGHSFTRFISPNALAWGADDPRRPDLRLLERLFRGLRHRGFDKVFFGDFPSELRPESVTADAVALLRDQVDNRALVVGLQSGSDAVLSRLHRGHTVAEGVDAVARIAAVGLTPYVDFIFGLPGETDDDRRRTRQIIRHLADSYDARIDSHVFTPLPGTPLAHAPPGRVDPATRRLVQYLVGRGNAAGHDVDQ